MAKFIWYRANPEKSQANLALAQQFAVRGYPTVAFVASDGKKLDQWSGGRDPDQLKAALEAVVKKAGPTEHKPRVLTPNSSAAETAADRKLKTAELYMRVNRNKDAKKILRDIIKLYPDTEAATKAAEDLEKLGG